jgi:hypothetical protein
MFECVRGLKPASANVSLAAAIDKLCVKAGGLNMAIHAAPAQ